MTLVTIVALGLAGCVKLPTCLTIAECGTHDGKRVALVGVYTPSAPMPPDWKIGHPVPVPMRIAVGDGEGPLLAPYWHEDAIRPLAEVERYAGKRVRVVGIFHQQSPPPPDSRMATLGGPCIHPIDTIETIPE